MKKELIYLFSLLTLLTCQPHSKEWHEKYKYDLFYIDGRKCIVVCPNTISNGKWIVRPAFCGLFPEVDDSLLSIGYHFGFCDVTHEYGAPSSQRVFQKFYQHVRKKYNLNERFIIEGFSRGGFFALTYACNHPHQIEKIYVDAPVCDLDSWPGQREPQLYQEAKDLWEKEGIRIRQAHNYPIKNINKVINNHIPIVICYGAIDTIVPYKENFGRISFPKRYPVRILCKPHCGHHPHSLRKCNEIVDFLTYNF